MIKSFEHKGLEKLFTKDVKTGVRVEHISSINDQLTALHTAMSIEDMNIPGWQLHQLKGNFKALWAVTVRENWRIVFRFENGDVYIVNYEDCH